MTLEAGKGDGTQSDVTLLNFPARGQAAVAGNLVLSLAVTKHLARGCLLADVTTSMCKYAWDNLKIKIAKNVSAIVHSSQSRHSVVTWRRSVTCYIERRKISMYVIFVCTTPSN